MDPMTEETEYRAVELTHDPSHPRRLRGTVVHYDTPALINGQFHESIRAGTFGDVTKLDLVLNLQHERPKALARTGGGGLVLRDFQDRLELEAILPETTLANDALEMVRGRILRGLSLEMRRVQDSWTGNNRTIYSATLSGVGLVDSPAHAGSLVEQRGRGGGGGGRGGRGGGLGDGRVIPQFISTKLYGLIPFSEVLACQCHKGKGDQISFDPGAFDEALAGSQEILAVKGEFLHALASRKKGSLRMAKQDDGVAWEMDLPNSEAARDLVAQMEKVNVLARPIFDSGGSIFVERAGVAHYSKVKMRGLILGASDADQGWAAVTTSKPTLKPKPKAEKREQVRIWL